MKTRFIFLASLAAIGFALPLKAQSNEVQEGTYAGHNSKGSNNVYLGSYSGWSDNSLAVPIPTSGDNTYNTFVGAFTGNVNVGILNSFVGGYSGWESKGQHNTFMGFEAGKSNNGAYNTFIGKESGKANAGVYNAALGLQSGLQNKGDYNIFSGYKAGNQNAGNRNISMGYAAGVSNVGNSNIILGAEAGGGNTGSFNIMIGEKAGLGNDGSANVMVGNYTGRSHINANFNTYIGHHAGEKNQLGNYNVFLGYQSGQYEVGSHKLYIANSASNILLYGDFAKKKLSVGGKIDSEYTLHVLGNVYSTGTWTSSDARFKQNIQKIEKPLEKLLAVNGVSYEFKKDDIRQFHTGKTYGFVAQELQKVMPAVVQADKQGYLAVNYECFIPLLVEALKEQQATHQQQIAALQKEIQELKELIGKKQVIIKQNAHGSTTMVNETLPKESSLAIPAVILHQNSPNPFTQATTIEYEVNQEAQQIAIHLYDLTGKPILQYTQLPAGKSQLTIQAGQLTPGMYLYSLLVDGNIADTKRMILTQ